MLKLLLLITYAVTLAGNIVLYFFLCLPDACSGLFILLYFFFFLFILQFISYYFLFLELDLKSKIYNYLTHLNIIWSIKEIVLKYYTLIFFILIFLNNIILILNINKIFILEGLYTICFNFFEITSLKIYTNIIQVQTLIATYFFVLFLIIFIIMYFFILYKVYFKVSNPIQSVIKVMIYLPIIIFIIFLIDYFGPLELIEFIREINNIIINDNTFKKVVQYLKDLFD